LIEGVVITTWSGNEFHKLIFHSFVFLHSLKWCPRKFSSRGSKLEKSTMDPSIYSLAVCI